MFLSTLCPVADVIDFSCADLFIRLIYSLGIYLLFIRQTGDGAWRCAKPWLCRDQYHKTLSCSQPGRRGKGITEWLRHAGKEGCAEICNSKNRGRILPLDGMASEVQHSGWVAVMNLDTGSRPSAFDLRVCHR